MICAEAFTSLLDREEELGRLHGVSICRSTLSISHLLFADDSLVFCQAKQKEVQVISDVLDLYAVASSQCINFEKSSVYFSSNTSRVQRDWIKNALRVREVEKFESYLGLPTLIGQSKYQAFYFLKERVWKKIQGWKGKLLSKAGKEVFIKAVAQSIPTYTMGVFQLPMKLCNELNMMCARFWWGQSGDDKKIHWKSWESLAQPKKEGGLGFRDIRSFNLAMLAKQGWRMLTNHDFLLYRYFKAKYFPRCTFLEATDHPKSSYVWKSLIAAQPILRKGCCWRVGSGSSIRVLSDKWLPHHPSNKILAPPNEVGEDWLVSELIDWNNFQWDYSLIDKAFSKYDAEAIYRIPLSKRYVPDVMVWMHNKNGRYSVRSGYHTARKLLRESKQEGEGSNLRASSDVWARIWKLYIPTKIKVFMWQACHDILPTYEKLQQQRIIKNDLCPICNRVPKTILHAVWECAAAQDVWAGCSHRLLQKGLTVQVSVLRLMEDLLNKLPLDLLEFFMVLCWLLWHRRNRVVHGGILQDPGSLVGRARNLLVEYLEARTHLDSPVFPVSTGPS